MVKLEVAYAKAEEQLIIPIQLTEPYTVERAIQLSGILKHYPEIDLAKNKVGIFSQICTLKKVLQANDRVEIYRSLNIDPMQARRERALKQQR
ncbi:MAG: RnfH family protein [Methyloprofundus sp.]|nr:RnfH family protein [Methyloprofundus sp.]